MILIGLAFYCTAAAFSGLARVLLRRQPGHRWRALYHTKSKISYKNEITY